MMGPDYCNPPCQLSSPTRTPAYNITGSFARVIDLFLTARGNAKTKNVSLRQTTHVHPPPPRRKLVHSFRKRGGSVSLSVCCTQRGKVGWSCFYRIASIYRRISTGAEGLVADLSGKNVVSGWFRCFILSDQTFFLYIPRGDKLSTYIQ